MVFNQTRNFEDHHPARITKADKDLQRELILKTKKFHSKLERLNIKLKKIISSALVFLVMK